MSHLEFAGSIESIEQQIGRWFGQLERARGKCLELYQAEIDRGLARLKTDSDFQKLAAKLHGIIATEVHKLLIDVWTSENEGGDGIAKETKDVFFYWPGYLRYATPNPGRLDVMRKNGFVRDSTEISAQDVVAKAHDGAGFFCMPGSQQAIHYMPLSIWMHLLYGKKLGDLELQGFTTWISANDEAYVQPGCDMEALPLTSIEFSFNVASSAVQDGVVYCPFIFDGDVDGIKEPLIKTLNTSRLIVFGKDEGPPKVKFPPFSFSGDARVPIEGIAQDLVAIIFASMFINCKSWSQQHKKDDSSRSLLNFIRDLQKRCKRHGLKEVGSALEEGVAAIMLMDDALCDRVFSFYYAIPLPSGMTIEGFHKIEGKLGTVNLYTTRRIPPCILHMLRSWFHRIYEDLRLLEIASDAEQGGVRTAAGAFQHEIKHLANAVGARWVIPAHKLFDVRKSTDSPSVLDGDFLGSIIIKDEARWIGKDFGVVPFRDVLDNMVSLLRLWTLSDSVADLPFRLDRSIHVEQFIRECLDAAQRAVEPHALTYSSAENVSQLYRFKKMRDLLLGIRVQQKNSLDVKVDRMLLIRQRDESSVWLGRLLIAVLKNAVQHGSPLEPIVVKLGVLGRQRWSVSIRNKIFHYHEVKNEIKNGALGIEASQLASDLSRMLHAVHQGAEEFATGARGFLRSETAQFKSGDIIDACLLRLGGETLLRDFDIEDENYYLNEFKLHY